MWGSDSSLSRRARLPILNPHTIGLTLTHAHTPHIHPLCLTLVLPAAMLKSLVYAFIFFDSRTFFVYTSVSMILNIQFLSSSSHWLFTKLGFNSSCSIRTL